MMVRAAIGVAAIICAAQTQIQTSLAINYGETRQGVQSVYGYTVETWANDATGTWTLIVVAEGQICVLDSGSRWRGQRINSTWFPTV